MALQSDCSADAGSADALNTLVSALGPQGAATPLAAVAVDSIAGNNEFADARSEGSREIKQTTAANGVAAPSGSPPIASSKGSWPATSAWQLMSAVALAIVRFRAGRRHSVGVQALPRVEAEPANVTELEANINVTKADAILELTQSTTAAIPTAERCTASSTELTALSLLPLVVEPPAAPPAMAPAVAIYEAVAIQTEEMPPASVHLVDAGTQTEPTQSWFGWQRKYIMAMLAPTGPESSRRGALFNLTNSILGAGVLGLPAYFAMAGYVSGTLLLAGQSLLMYYTVHLLTRVARAENADSYGKCAEIILSVRGAVVVQFFIMANNLGALIAYVVLVRDFVRVLAENYSFPDRLVANALLLLIVYPLVLKASAYFFFFLCVLGVSLCFLSRFYLALISMKHKSP